MVDEVSAPPSIDPADEDSLVGAFRSILGKFLQNMDDCLPATVIAVEGRNRVTVQPLVMMVSTDGEKVSRAQVASVRLLNIGGGDFVLSFPIKPGDLGWLKASDRDISLVTQSLGTEAPNTKRMHSFEDGWFIPDVMRAWTLNGADAERVVLQSTDGLTRIAVGADIVEITAPATVKITAPNIDLNGASLTHNGVNIGSTHHHGNVQNGAGVTDPPS